MANRTLLAIIQAVQQELGLPQSATVIGNTDVTTSQLLGLAQLEVEELAKNYNWTRLTQEYDLVVNPPINLTGTLSANSPIITSISPNTTGLTAQYFTVIGPSIPIAARIQSVDSSSQITMTMEYTGANASLQALVMSQDTYPEPTDFDHFINRTWWDRTNRWELLGPDSPQMDQWHRSGIVVTGPRRHFRQIGFLANVYRIWPPPSEIVNPLQLVFEYQSTYRVFTGGNVATPNALWTSDTDTPILNDRAVIMGIKWRFWQQKGFNFALLRNDYDMFVDREKARDGAAPTLSMVKRVHPIFISPANVQDGFFPGPVGPNTG